MTIALCALAALWLAQLWRTRADRKRRWHLARETRRSRREQQWRAMIRDAGERTER